MENERKMKQREQLLQLTDQNKSKLSIIATQLTQLLSAAGAATVNVCDK